MKSVERIEKLIKERRYKASAETYDKALGSFLQAVDEHIEQKSAPTEPKIWRIIMNSRITKLAAAAVIIIAAYAIINQSGGSIDITTVTFAQITENMERMPWLHAVVEGAGESMESWFCYERRILVSKRANGEARCQDDRRHIIQTYNPDTNTVTVSPSGSDSFALGGMGGSASDFPKLVMKMFGDAGKKVIRETGKYKGKDVLIFKMSAFLGGMDMKVEMTVDAEKNILIHINQKAFDEAGRLAMEANGYFDYPETGPESIYDVGVPTSAKVVNSEKEEERTAYDKAFEEAISVVDARESWPEPRELVVAYWQARNAKNYDEMAVLWPSSAVWNQELEKEEPVEYVFGEAQPREESKDHIIVPFASKRYHGKHGKYNLKMILVNKKSAKGRYYIKSGN